MRKMFALAAAALVLITPQLSAQSTGTITGVVTDQGTQQPIAGVQVFIAGTQIGNITNQQGRYLITNAPAGEQTVRAVVIGYSQAERTVTVVAGESVTADMVLRTTAVDLDAVVVSVVTGRAERKRELGTNTASISAAELERAPITRMADVLVGRAAGVQLQGVAGTVGTSQRIRIRGANSISLSNEPLIFVDGVQMSNSKGGIGVGGQDFSRLNDINAEDISNIEILKGPAASALYGTAAANGVILITTRRGSAGPGRWRAYAEYGSSSDRNPYPTSYLPVQINDPTAPMYTDLGRLNRGTTEQAADGTGPYRFCANESAARGICTQDAIAQWNPINSGINPFQSGQRQQYGLSVGGGGDAMTYFLSGDYTDETGVISFNTQERISVRGNFGARVLDNLGLNLNAAYTRSRLAMNQNDNNIFSPLINMLLATPEFVPTAEQRVAGGPGSRAGTGFGYYVDDIEQLITNQLVDRYMLGASGNWQPISWLSLNSNLGLDYFSRNDHETLQPGRLPIAATYTPGYRDGRRASNYIWSMSSAAVASHQLTPELASTTTLGGAFTREQFEDTQCYGVGIVEGTRSCSATSSLFRVIENYTEVRTIGAYLQQQLAWRDRLFLAASVRGDDNSAFGQDFGFIYYPGASVSWVVSDESFFPEIDALSSLRLRAAYGRSGQRPNFRDAVTLLDPVAASVNNQELSAVRLSRVGNPDLKPERTSEFEVGFDVSFLQERIALEFGYFNKESSDALVARPLPPSFGLTGELNTTGQIWDNLGSIRNWGTELALIARLVQTPQFGLNMRVSATTLRNRIEDMGGMEPIVFNRGTQMHKDGFSAGGFFAPRWEVRPGASGLLTRDDVLLTVDSAAYVGPSLPTNSQSLSGEISLFRNLVSVSALFERRAGHYQVNYTEWFRCTTGFSRAGGHTGNANCQGVGDPNAPAFEQARFIAGRFGAVDPDDDTRRVTSLGGYIEPADFIKWRELSVTLGIPQQLLAAAPALRGASITVSGRNLATWSDYTGIDPEINESGGSANFTQGEFNTQPPLRYFTLRLNYTF